jgi:hypothetical protein
MSIKPLLRWPALLGLGVLLAVLALPLILLGGPSWLLSRAVTWLADAFEAVRNW